MPTPDELATAYFDQLTSPLHPVQAVALLAETQQREERRAAGRGHAAGMTATPIHERERKGVRRGAAGGLGSLRTSPS